MKITILNGSPRKGNTHKAIEAFKSALGPQAEVEDLHLYDYDIKPCRNCNGCKRGVAACVLGDDSNALIDRIVEADVLVWGTPVYYWGMSAQMKLLIDKFYSSNDRLRSRPKKVVTIICGANTTDNVQYEIIDKQFKAICAYLKWDYTRCIPVSAYEPDDITRQPEVLDTLAQTARML